MKDLVNRKIPSFGIKEPKRNPRILEIQLEIQDLKIQGENIEKINKLREELEYLVDEEPVNEELELYKKALDAFEDTDYWKDPNTK